MPSRELANFNSSRVHRASRLNVLEQVRLQQRMVLLEKARLRQARLSNQDIRLISSAMDYIVNSSGHSPEGREQGGQQSAAYLSRQPEKPYYFLYGERVVSRKVRRMARPQSAVERAAFNHRGRVYASEAEDDIEHKACGMEDSLSSCSRLSQRPLTSPAVKGRRWSTPRSGSLEWEWKRGVDVASERPSSGDSSSLTAVTTPRRHDWEDATHDITKKMLAAQRLQQQHHLSAQRTRSSSVPVWDVRHSHTRSRSSRSYEVFRDAHTTLSPVSSLAARGPTSIVFNPKARATPLIEDPVRPVWRKTRSASCTP